jgi:hypothetical protein
MLSISSFRLHANDEGSGKSVQSQWILFRKPFDRLERLQRLERNDYTELGIPNNSVIKESLFLPENYGKK